MSLNKSARAGHRFIPAGTGAGYATYDLSGQQQRSRSLCDRLNQLVPDLERSLTAYLRRLLNHDSVQVSVSSWAIKAPAQAAFWLQAFPARQGDNTVLLGMDRPSMFILSELFFGGEPEKLTDKQLETRPLADTERRLTNRILDRVLRSLCPGLGYELDSWHSDWADTASMNLADERFWSEVTVTAGDCQLTIQLAWPLSLPEATQTAADINGEALKSGLRQALKGVTTRLTVEVASMELPLGELSNLKAGDILPMDLAAEVSARSGDTDCLKGIICENGDQLALRVTRHVGVRHE